MAFDMLMIYPELVEGNIGCSTGFFSVFLKTPHVEHVHVVSGLWLSVSPAVWARQEASLTHEL